MRGKAPVAQHGHSLQATGNAVPRPPVQPECPGYSWTAAKLHMPPSTLHCWLNVCFDLMRRIGGVMVWSAIIACLPVQARAGVTLLLSEPVGIYQEAAQALQRELTQDDGLRGIRLQHVDERPNLTGASDDLIVTLGVRALKYALDGQASAPLFALLVPSQTFETLISTHPQASRRRPISALFLDQPYARQMQLIRLALPETRRVGVLLGAAMVSQADDLKRAGREVGLDVRVYRINGGERLFAGLTGLAREVDVLLLLPDPQVVNGESLRAVFLQTYQLRLPIVAYASSLVQAGATIGLYATPAQLGSESGKWIRGMYSEKRFGEAESRFPQRYTVEVNRNVARTLELPLPSVELLGKRLEAERKR